MFIYKALLDTYKVGNVPISVGEFVSEYKHLQQDEGLYTNETKLEQQYKVRY